MSLSADDIIKIMEKAKEMGVSDIKVDGFEAKLSAPVIHGAVPEISAEELMKSLDPFADLTDEEILYYATPYYDELQHIKADHQRKIDGEKDKA